MKRFAIFLLVVANVIVLTSCRKDRNDLILGSWVSTEYSYNPGGTIPAGTICLKFRADDSVEIDDLRVNCVMPVTWHYSISKDSLTIDKIDNYGLFLITSLERNHMTLMPIHPNWWDLEVFDFERAK